MKRKPESLKQLELIGRDYSSLKELNNLLQPVRADVAYVGGRGWRLFRFCSNATTQTVWIGIGTLEEIFQSTFEELQNWLEANTYQVIRQQIIKQ